MRISKGDLGVMRRSLITLAIAASCAVALILFSENRSELADKDWHDAQRQLRAAQSELDNARQDQSNMASYLDEYAASVGQHLIGEEPRLDWLESLDKLHQQKLVSDLHYNIAPQKTYTPQPAIDSGSFDIKYSEMKLQLDLLHERQLLDFFDALRKQVKGWYQLDGCSIVRAPGDSQNTRVQLKAECTGGWLTLKNRNATP